MRKFVYDKDSKLCTAVDPVDAHITRLRHIRLPQSLQRILMSTHGYSLSDAKEIARLATPYIDLGIRYLESSLIVDRHIQPTLQYYGFMNLAVSVVLVYRPNEWNSYKKHGAEDLTKNLDKLTLNTKIMEVRSGVTRLFSRVLYDIDLPNELSLRDLMNSTHSTHVEYSSLYKTNSIKIRVIPKIEKDPSSGKFFSQFTFKIDNSTDNNAKFPSVRLYRNLPILKELFDVEVQQGRRIFNSKQKWSSNNPRGVAKFHSECALKLSNLGGQSMIEFNDPESFWLIGQGSPILPTMVASYLLSFCLGSLSRYRPNILRNLESSELGLIWDTFSKEVPRYMIPGFTNLLYGKVVQMRQFTSA